MGRPGSLEFRCGSWMRYWMQHTHNHKQRINSNPATNDFRSFTHQYASRRGNLLKYIWHLERTVEVRNSLKCQIPDLYLAK
jgi:hypothetical protein